MKKVLEYLEQLGLSKVEAKLYLLLLKKGPMTVSELAFAASLNRTALYSYVTALLEKGIIAEVKRQAGKKLKATEPDNLHYLIDNQIENLRVLDGKFPDILKTINTNLIRCTNNEKADVHYYRGRKGLETIIDEVLRTKVLRVYVNLSEAANFFLPSDFDIYDRALKRNKSLKIYELIGDKPDEVINFNLSETAKSGRYFYKFLPSDIGLFAITFIYDNKVAILNVKNDMCGVIFYNSDYYHNSKKLFDFIWKMLPKPKEVI